MGIWQILLWSWCLCASVMGAVVGPSEMRMDTQTFSVTEPEQHPVLWLCHIQRRTWALWQDDARCWHAHGKKEKMELALHYKREQCSPNEASASPSWSLVLFSSRVNSSRCLLLLLLILLLLTPPSSCCHNIYIVGMEEEEQEEQLPKAVAERSPAASPAPPKTSVIDGRSEFIYRI